MWAAQVSCTGAGCGAVQFRQVQFGRAVQPRYLHVVLIGDAGGLVSKGLPLQLVSPVVGQPQGVHVCQRGAAPAAGGRRQRKGANGNGQSRQVGRRCMPPQTQAWPGSPYPALPCPSRATPTTHNISCPPQRRGATTDEAPQPRAPPTWGWACFQSRGGAPGGRGSCSGSQRSGRGRGPQSAACQAPSSQAQSLQARGLGSLRDENPGRDFWELGDIRIYHSDFFYPPGSSALGFKPTFRTLGIHLAEGSWHGQATPLSPWRRFLDYRLDRKVLRPIENTVKKIVR